MDFIKNKLLYLLAFTISKASVFIAPLLLTEFMTKAQYGKFEYAIGGLGFIVTRILSLGIPSSYAYFILSKKDIIIKSGFSLYILLLIIYFILIQFGVFVYATHVYLSLIVSYILVNQLYYSYVFKTNGKVIYATLLDGGIYFLILLIVLLKKFNDQNVGLNDFIWPMLLYGTAFATVGLYSNNNLNFSIAWIQFKKIVSYSFYIMISSFLIILLLNSGRFILEFYSNSFEEIGIYGFYLRVSGISLVIFQMLYILLFKKIYTGAVKTLDKIFSLFILFILFYSVVSLYVLPPILKYFSTFFRDTFRSNSIIFLALTFFTFYWTVYNIFSNIMIREGMVKKYNYYLVAILMIFSGGLVLFPGVNVKVFSIFQLIIGGLVVATQQFMLCSKGFVFAKTLIVLAIALVINIVFCLFY